MEYFMSSSEVSRRASLRLGITGDVRLAPSIFPSLGNYVSFRGNVPNTTIFPGVKLLVKYAGPTTRAVRRTFADAGFLPCSKTARSFHICWGSPKTLQYYMLFSPGQLINQIPGSNATGRKDKLADYIIAAQNRTSNIEFVSDLVLAGYDRAIRQLVHRSRPFDYIPKTFFLPGGEELIKRDMSSNPDTFYIYKPALGARGEGIRLLCADDKLPSGKSAVVQRYVSNPLLVCGFKFDLRVYVLVTSVNPLIVYIYNEGLGRFATRAYRRPTRRNRKMRNMHLTNFSVNGASAGFINPDTGSASPVRAAQQIDVSLSSSSDHQSNEPSPKASRARRASNGSPASSDDHVEDTSCSDADNETLQNNLPSKWRMSDLLAYIDSHWEVFLAGRPMKSTNEQQYTVLTSDPEHILFGAGMPGNGVVKNRLFASIKDIIIKTFVACEANFYSFGLRARTMNVLPRINFGIYGFDIMLTDKGAPVLIEVNSSPATGTSTRLDMSVKYPMLSDALNTIGLYVEKRSERELILPANMTDEERRLQTARSKAALLTSPYTSSMSVSSASSSTDSLVCRARRPQTVLGKTRGPPSLLADVGSRFSRDMLTSAGAVPAANYNRFGASVRSARDGVQSSGEARIPPMSARNIRGAQRPPSSKTGGSNNVIHGRRGGRLPFNELRYDSDWRSHAIDDIMRVDKSSRVRFVLPLVRSLSAVEKRMLMQIVDEDHRSGGFIRIFPSSDACSYLTLFEAPRYSNVLAAAFVCAGCPHEELDDGFWNQ